MALYFLRRPAIYGIFMLCVLFVSTAIAPQALASTKSSASTASVTLAPTSGNPNSWFKANGYGWSTNGYVDVYWYNIAGPVAGGYPDNNGNFVFSIQVINYVQPGTYQLLFEAVDGLTGQKTDVYKSFTIVSPSKVTVQKVWTADGNNNTKTTFAPGDTIHYMLQVNNSGSSTVTATFTFLATGPQQIFSWSGSASVASGTEGFYSPSTIPSKVPAGTYTLTVSVTYNGASSSGTSQFTVKPILQAVYSPIWSGYVVQGQTANQVVYTNVKGSWIVPMAECSKGETSRSAVWVGIGGIEGDKYLEQIGTTADCNNGNSNYYAWYEMVPSNPVPINCGSGLKANDKVSAEVMSLGGGKFSLSIDTPECSFEIPQTQQAAELNSAEWIVEDTHDVVCSTSSTDCPLTHFITNKKPFVNFSSCSANGNPITANPLLRSFSITDTGDANGTLKAFPLHTTTNDSAFTVEWVHS